MMVGSSGRAVVLGGSMAGLLAARALSESHRMVTIVDRDTLLGVTRPRRGVPQGRHAHGLLARGQQALEEFFPGITGALHAEGVPVGDLGRDLRWYFNGKRLHPSETGLVCLSASRPRLEAFVRDEVHAMSNVEFVERCDVVGLVSSDGRNVDGARVQRAGAAAETLPADLVVDATGRGSRTPRWLQEFGYAKPPEERIKIDLAYTTRHFRLSRGDIGGDLSIIPVATPGHPRGAFFSWIGGDVTLLSLTGVLGDYPPTDEAGFMQYVRSLPVPDIYRTVRDAEPVDDIATHRYPASVRRHYERLPRFPEGLVVVGDAGCSFNPVYGQGMTVAALCALTLREHAAAGPVDPRRFHRDVAAVVDDPWDISAGGDLGFAGVPGARPAKVRLANRYMARLHAAAVHDSRLTAAFMRTAGLVESPQALMRPSTMWRVLRPSANAGTAEQVPPRASSRARR
jgi:2-polyprenyl-6-methoxyphenol hydroxylase-like FAD-dependent oxidoreductase